MAGVPYDGVQRRTSDLYHDITEVHTKLDWNETGITEAWKQMWFRRIQDLVEQVTIPTFCIATARFHSATSASACSRTFTTSAPRNEAG